MIGILSDIHGFVEPLEQVLEQLRIARVDEIYCLGDITTGGGQDGKCIDLLRMHRVQSIQGNHDTVFLRKSKDTPLLEQRTLEYLSESPLFLARDNLLFVHTPMSASKFFPYEGSVLIESEADTKEGAAYAFKLLERATHCNMPFITFIGHTHRATAWELRNGLVRELSLGTLTLQTDATYLINPGAVGSAAFSSLDTVSNDVHSSYLLYDQASHRIEFKEFPVKRDSKIIVAIQNPEVYGLFGSIQIPKALHINESTESGNFDYDKNDLKGIIAQELSELQQILESCSGDAIQASVLRFVGQANAVCSKLEKILRATNLSESDIQWCSKVKLLYADLKSDSNDLLELLTKKIGSSQVITKASRISQNMHFRGLPVIAGYFSNADLCCPASFSNQLSWRVWEESVEKKVKGGWFLPLKNK